MTTQIFGLAGFPPVSAFPGINNKSYRSTDIPGMTPFHPVASLSAPLTALTEIYKQFAPSASQQSVDQKNNPNNPENATLNALAMTIGMNPALASVLGIGSVVIGLFKKFSEKADKKAEKADPQAAEKFGLNAKNLDPEQLKQQLSALKKEKDQLIEERDATEDKIKAAELQRKIEELEENERKLQEELEKARKLAEQRAKTWGERMKRWKERAKRFQEKLVRKAEQPQKTPADLEVAATEARDQYKTQAQTAPITAISGEGKRGVFGPDAKNNFASTQGTSTGTQTTNMDFGQGYTYSTTQQNQSAVASKTTDAPTQTEQPNAFAEYAKQQMRKMEETLAKNQSPLQNLKPSRSMAA